MGSCLIFAERCFEWGCLFVEVVLFFWAWCFYGTVSGVDAWVEKAFYGVCCLFKFLILNGIC